MFLCFCNVFQSLTIFIRDTCFSATKSENNVNVSNHSFSQDKFHLKRSYFLTHQAKMLPLNIKGHIVFIFIKIPLTTT